MARIEVRVPALGESVPAGVVSRWFRQVGNRVEAGEHLLDVSTDKVDVEVAANAAGRLAEVLAGEGQEVAPGALLAVIETDDAVPLGGSLAPAAPRRQELQCLRCGARLEPAASAGGRMAFAGEPVHLLVCRQCGHVEMVAEDPSRF